MKPAAVDTPVNLLVVNDPAIAASVGKLRAEWKARTGRTLNVKEMPAADLPAESLEEPLDAIIYPAELIGRLVGAKWIDPLPADYASNRELDWSDVFELEQLSETVWGKTPYAVPLGSPVFVCFYRADLFERAHKRPPETWAEYHELASYFQKRENLGDAIGASDTWSGTIEPLGKSWAARVLLARAAAYAKHRDQYSTLFKIDTMEPLVAGPPFVRALEEMMADAKLGPSGTTELDPAAARREFLAGHAAMALSWPSRAANAESKADGDKSTTGKPGEKAVTVAFSELPGAGEAYNITAKSWENRKRDENTRVTLLGVAGRLGSVASQSAQPAVAFKLLAWLSGRDSGAEVGARPAARRRSIADRR